MGDAPDGASAVRLAGEVQPDVVLVDLRMPGLDGNIAAHLGIAERTVKAYLSSIYTKLEVDSRAAAAAKALGNGWLSTQAGKR